MGSWGTGPQLKGPQPLSRWRQLPAVPTQPRDPSHQLPPASPQVGPAWNDPFRTGWSVSVPEAGTQLRAWGEGERPPLPAHSTARTGTSWRRGARGPRGTRGQPPLPVQARVLNQNSVPQGPHPEDPGDSQPCPVRGPRHWVGTGGRTPLLGLGHTLEFAQQAQRRHCVFKTGIWGM